jgi:hypothetical protein
MRRNFWAVMVAVGVGLTAGCGGGSKGTGTADEGYKAALEELGETLKSLAAEGRKPPGRMAELEPIEPMMAVAGPAIRTGDIVYIWGAGYADGGKQVVAYEKKTPNEGGYVLLQDGTVKKMTADEFKSAPQAKK